MARATLPGDQEAGWEGDAEVCGWGATGEDGDGQAGSDVLMAAKVPIVADAGERGEGGDWTHCGTLLI